MKDPTKAGQGRVIKDDRKRLAKLHEVEAILREPELYTIAESAPEQARVGNRRKYPTVAYVAIPFMKASHGSFDGVSTELGHPVIWNHVAGILAEELALRDPETPWTRERLEALGAPSSQNYRDARDTWLAPALANLRTHLQVQGKRVGDEMGLGDPKTPNRLAQPRRENALTADGKVITPLTTRYTPLPEPTDKEVEPKTTQGKKRRKTKLVKDSADSAPRTERYVDVATGEIVGPERMDGQRTHHTGAGDQFGHKYIEVSARTNDPKSRVIYDFFRQTDTSEAMQATEAAIAIRDRSPGFTHYVSDTATRGVHMDKLARAGFVPVNPKTAKSVTENGDREEYSGYLTTIACGDHQHILHYDGAWVSELITLEDGTSRLRHLQHRRPKQVKDKNGYRLYAEYDLPCDILGITHERQLFATTNDPDELAAGFHRAENVHAIPPGSQMYSDIYGWREDRESNNALRDHRLHMRRAGSRSAHHEDINQIALSMALNTFALTHHRMRLAQPAEPAAA